MKSSFRRAVLVVALCASAGMVAAADVAGKWKGEFDSQIGVQKYVFDLKVDGETVTGKAAFERMGDKGEVELTEGKVSGDDVSFVEPMDFQGMALRIVYTGKVAGDEIAFTRQVGDFATETFTATRVKEE